MSSINDRYSFSLVSTAGIDTISTLSDQETDEFELIYDEEDGERSHDDASSCDSTSVPPDVHAHEFEHGRRYHSFKSGRYPLPNDIVEQHREETMHALMVELMDGKLFLSDIGEFPQSILDIGTGTGTWAIYVADLYPSASVVGTDLSPIQPKWMPINARMLIDDCEDPDWMHGCGIDLVHFRGVCDVLLDLDGMVASAYHNIKTGGWIEFQEFDHLVLCDDGTMEDDDPVRVFSELYARGMREYGCAAYGKQNLRQTLERAGFDKVKELTMKVPVSTWARNEKLRTIGLLMKINILEGLDGFAAKPLAALGISAEQRKNIIAGVRESLENDRVHRYVNCRICFGQKKDKAAGQRLAPTQVAMLVDDSE